MSRPSAGTDESPEQMIRAFLRKTGCSGSFAFQIAAATSLGITRVVAELHRMETEKQVARSYEDSLLTRWKLVR